MGEGYNQNKVNYARKYSRNCCQKSFAQVNEYFLDVYIPRRAFIKIL